MNRKNFALSWGRKVFFGMCWPLTCLLTFIYLQSQFLPMGAASWAYFVATAVGLSGLITSVAYFLFYCPVISIFSSYYFSRIWSVLLIVFIQAGILIDGFIFSQFRFHINKFILDLIASDGMDSLAIKPSSFIMLVILLLIIAGTIWFRGERMWRLMQKRFSNPVQNWYLLLIVLLLVASHLLYSSDSFQHFGRGKNLASLFPLNYQNSFFPKSKHENVSSAFYYPKKELKCTGKAASNIVFISIAGWDTRNFNLDVTPFIYHLPDHGTSFENHHYVAKDRSEALFALLYGLPAIYRNEASTKTPAIMAEAKKRGYEFFIKSDLPELKKLGSTQPGSEPLGAQWKTWREGKSAPFFAMIDLEASNISWIDSEVRDLFAHIHNQDVLKDTLFVVTGSHASLDQTVPFFVIWPNRRKGEWSHPTTHHDVAASVMQSLWDCKNKLTDFSDGKSLFLGPERAWDVYGNENEVVIHNHQNNELLMADWNGNISKSKATSQDRTLLLTVLRDISRFYRN